jgi:hypothetical protein
MIILIIRLRISSRVESGVRWNDRGEMWLYMLAESRHVFQMRYRSDVENLNFVITN